MAMYRISDSQLAQVQDEIAKRDSTITKLRMKDRARKAASQAKTVGEIVGTGLIMGAVRGKFEKHDGTFNIPGVNFDLELALGLAITGAGLLGAQGKGPMNKYSDDILTVGSTILAGFARGVAKHWGKTGAFKMSGVSGELPGGWVGMSADGVASDASVVDALADAGL